MKCKDSSLSVIPKGHAYLLIFSEHLVTPWSRCSTYQWWNTGGCRVVKSRCSVIVKQYILYILNATHSVFFLKLASDRVRDYNIYLIIIIIIFFLMLFYDAYSHLEVSFDLDSDVVVLTYYDMLCTIIKK